jgi:hypothetical protein
MAIMPLATGPAGTEVVGQVKVKAVTAPFVPVVTVIGPKEVGA